MTDGFDSLVLRTSFDRKTSDSIPPEDGTTNFSGKLIK